MAPIPLSETLYPALALVWLACSAASSLYDLRLRIIPDWLNYASLAVAVGACAALGGLDLGYGLFVAAGFAFAWALYKLGVWAGGDVKFFTASSAWFGLLKSTQPLTLGEAFVASAFLAFPIAVVWYRHRLKENDNAIKGIVANSWKAAGLAGAFSAIGAVFSSQFGILPGLVAGLVASLLASRHKAITALIAAGCLILSPYLFVVGGIGGAAVGWAGFMLINCFVVLSPRVLRRTVPVSQLQEGDIPFSSVYVVNGTVRYWTPPSVGDLLAMAWRLDASELSRLSPPPNPVASCLDAGGLSNAQISDLKKAGGVTKLVVKESLPFAPAIALGFIAMWFLA